MELDNIEEQEDVAVALLRDGTLAEYDCAVMKYGTLDQYLSTLSTFRCHGTGVIHSVNGEMITDDNTEYRFYSVLK